MSAPESILRANGKGVQMDQIVIIGALAGILGVIVAVLRYDSSPLDEAIKEAQQWDSKQKRMAQALERK
jgi:H+/gluconate symporter-like permease